MLTFFKNNSRSILLLLLAALIIWLYLWLFGSPVKGPVPTLQVSPGSIMVTPDKTLGANLVKIRALNAEDGQELASGTLTAPFDTSLNLSFDQNIGLVRLEMQYNKGNNFFGRPQTDQVLLKIGPPVGVPIVGVDVPIGRSGTNFEITGPNWCDCTFGPTGVTDRTECPSTTTKNFRFAIGDATTSTGKYKVEVTKNTSVGGVAATPETSRFIISVDNPSAGVMNVLYYTTFNMACSTTTLVPALSNDMHFNLLAFGKLLNYDNQNTASPLKYTCQVQKMVDCDTAEGVRYIIVKCDDTPPPSGTIVTYSVSVTKATSACAPGGVL